MVFTTLKIDSLEKKVDDFAKIEFEDDTNEEQAGAELCQAQHNLC